MDKQLLGLQLPENQEKILQSLRIKETSKAHENALNAILKAKPENENQATALLHATVRAHNELVRLESPADTFLAAARGDHLKAAAWMERYWKERQKLFGERAFRPLTMTGQGALSKPDEEVYKSGFFLNLPNDSLGRPVVSYNRAFLEKDFKSEDLPNMLPNVMRCVFYVLSIAMNNLGVSGSESELVLLFVHEQKTFTSSSFDNTFHDNLRRLVAVFPVVTSHAEVVFVSCQQEISEISQEAITKSIRDLEYAKCHTYASHSTGHLLDMLERNGLEAAGLPTAAGGEWVHYTRFHKFRRSRVVPEALIEAAASNSLTNSAIQAIFEQEVNKQRKRSQDVIYARGKRQRTKEQAAELRTTVKNLCQTKESLTRENFRLQALLERASLVVSQKAEESIQVLLQDQYHCAAAQHRQLQLQAALPNIHWSHPKVTTNPALTLVGNTALPVHALAYPASVVGGVQASLPTMAMQQQILSNQLLLSNGMRTPMTIQHLLGRQVPCDAVPVLSQEDLSQVLLRLRTMPSSPYHGLPPP